VPLVEVIAILQVATIGGMGVLLDPCAHCALSGIVYYPDPEHLNFFSTKLGFSWLLWMQDSYSAVG
jgi:hypothetical protein